MLFSQVAEEKTAHRAHRSHRDSMATTTTTTTTSEACREAAGSNVVHVIVRKLYGEGGNETNYI